MFRSIIAVLSIACSVAAYADDRPTPPRYETRAQHDPDGIGKFHMGREIAQVMGPAGIPWLERTTREDEERPDLMLEALQLKGGEIVADFGAGSGYYTFKLARLAGPKGTVVAVDIEPRMLEFIRQRAAKEGLTNVGLIQNTIKEPRLPPNRFDLVLLVDVYHELEFPHEVMRGLREALKPSGRVALVEFRKEDSAVPIKELHKMSEDQIIRELSAAGLKHLETVRTLPLQHLVLFGKE